MLPDFVIAEHVAGDAKAVATSLVTADALLDASMQVRITDDMIKDARCLKVISCATTGSDHIDRSELMSRDIALLTLRENPELLQTITPAAELSWALILAAARHLKTALKHTELGNWDRQKFPGLMLNGRQLGLIGCGRIGRWMARYGEAFGMKVVGYDPNVNPWPVNIQSMPLEGLLETSDVVSVHVHLTDDTRGLISSDLFKIVLATNKPLYMTLVYGRVSDYL